MVKRRDGSLEKSARLIILMEMRSAGELEDLSLQKIADKFKKPPHRSTIMRDLRDLERLQKTLSEMRK